MSQEDGMSKDSSPDEPSDLVSGSQDELDEPSDLV